MECQVIDSKKLLTSFESSLRRKHSGRRRDELDRHSAPSETSVRSNIGRKSVSAMNSVHEIEVISDAKKKDRESSLENVAVEGRRRSHKSPRRHGHRNDSFALKRGGGQVESTPRSNSPRKNSGEKSEEHNSSFIYDCVEEALKNDKKKRQSKREHRSREHHSRDRKRRDGSRRGDEGDRRRHRRLRDEPELCDTSPEDRRGRDPDPDPPKEGPDAAAMLDVFAKLCAQMTQQAQVAKGAQEVHRSPSHKSLHCEADVKPERLDERPSKIEKEYYREGPAFSRYNSQTYLRAGYEDAYYRDRDRVYYREHNPREGPDILKASESEIGKYREYPLTETRTKCYIEAPGLRHRDRQEYRDYPSRERRDRYDEDRRRCEQKTSRSFELHREVYEDDRLRKTSRSEEVRDKIFDEPRDVCYSRSRSKRDLNERCYDDRRDRYQSLPRERCKSRRAFDSRYDRSVVDDVPSDRERDSMISPIDEDKSIISETGNNSYRAVKQEISEQRESIDKMMKLWKDMMASFKVLQNPAQNSKLMEEKTSDFRDSAEAQLQLWRECMRRYETVARDVGDTDARLMEEIGKQRGEIEAMSAMWQECLQRYKEISKDFNTLKKQVQPTEATSHQTVCPVLVAADGEGAAPPAHYRVPQHYLPPQACRAPLPAYHASDATLRSPPPPPWGWCPRDRREPSRRRQSSPESRAGSRERARRHKDRDDSRYKEKSSKPNGTRVEHRHRKR